MLLGELLPCVDNAKIPRFITERRYASAARVKALCLSVCLSVCQYVTSRSSIEKAERIELVIWHRGFSWLHIRFKGVRVGPISKNKGTRTLSQTLNVVDFSYFFRHTKSIVKVWST